MKTLPQSYFRHDATASSDAKMLQLKTKFGYEGAGVFWHAVETLYLNDGAIESETMRSLFERNANALQHCIDIGLLVECDGMIFSERLNEEISYRIEKSEKAKKSAHKRWHSRAKKQVNANAMRTQCERNARRGEERKGKEKRRKPPSEVQNGGVAALVSVDAVVVGGWDELVRVASQELGCRKAASKPGEVKYNTRLKTYSHEQLIQAFRNLKNECDKWKIKNNGFRPLTWWLKSDDRIEEMLGCHLKQGKKGTMIRVP